MSTKRPVGRFTAVQAKVRSAATRKKDRSINLCAFTFADGRQCRTPRRSGHPHLCYYHAQKEAQSKAAKQAGEAISSFFFSDYLSACDLSAPSAGFSPLSLWGTSSPKLPPPSPISARP
jgi:hypothetical protein